MNASEDNKENLSDRGNLETIQKDPWESLAFQFCKIATFALVFQKYTFFAATVLAGLTYWYVFFRGVKDTRCVLKKPLIVAIFWSILAPVAAYFAFR